MVNNSLILDPMAELAEPFDVAINKAFRRAGWVCKTSGSPSRALVPARLVPAIDPAAAASQFLRDVEAATAAKNFPRDYVHVFCCGGETHGDGKSFMWLNARYPIPVRMLGVPDSGFPKQ